ncbi:MAG: hypothetical protein IJ062_00505 [Firmicutes bacterium]|nr:hypothetical protein [Bacillota bacterium]
MFNRKIIKLFESRRVNLDARLRQDYVKNGIATLPCHISDYNDIISPYSVNGYETLNMEFADYLKTCVEFASPEIPIVLNITGDCLSDKEKKTIKETIRETFEYELGMVEKEEKRHTKVFILMTVGLILSGILLYFTHSLDEESRELFFIPFWFMGDTLCDYIFLTGYDIRHNRRMAGRLASIKVVFSDKYEEPNYTDDDVDKLYSEIEKDVKETIREDGE